MKLTNSYCEGIHKAFTHYQYKCQTCGLWTIWEHMKTGEKTFDCNCQSHHTPPQQEATKEAR